MKLRSLILVLVCIAGLWPAISAQGSGKGGNEQWCTLFGTVDANATRLYFELRGWPQDLQGFNVKRRKAGGNWSQLNGSVIRPEVNYNKDWKNLGMNESQIAQAKQTYTVYFQEGEAYSLSKENLLSALKSAGGPQSGDRIKMKKDFNMVMIIGMGYIDNTGKTGDGYEYGLFYVQDNGTERSEPLSLFVPQQFDAEGTTFAEDVEVNRLDKGVTLTWKCARSLESAASINGFVVYRKGKSGKFQKVQLSPLGKTLSDGEHGIWRFNDAEMDNTKDHSYKIVPVDMFQNELPETELAYTAADFIPVVPPILGEVELVDDVDLKVNWSFPKGSDLSRVKSVEVEFFDRSILAFRGLSGNIPKTTLSYTDKQEKEYSQVYIYRIVTIDMNGHRWPSAEADMLYLGEAKPATPKNLKAKFVKVGQEAFVDFTWDAKTEEEAGTKGYALFADFLSPGNFYKMAEIPLITRNHYRYKIETEGGKPYNFQVAGIGLHGTSSDPAEVSLPIPVLKMPWVQNLKAELQGDFTVKLTWNYNDVKGLRGFKVYMNGKEYAGTKIVKAGMREYVVKKPKTGSGKVAKFQVQAIGEAANSKLSPTQSLYIRNEAYAGKALRPENFVAKRLKVRSDHAHLEWKQQDMGKLDIQGYVLYVDYAVEGAPSRMGSLPLIMSNEYDYKLPDMDRKTYTFRIAPIDNNQKIGPYAEVILDMSKKPE